MIERIEIPTSTLKITEEDVYRAQGVKPEGINGRWPDIRRSTQAAIELGSQKVKLTGWLRELPVHSIKHDSIILEDEHVLTGNLIMQKLAGSTSVCFAIGTVGDEIEQYVSHNFQHDPVFCYTLDAVGTVYIERFVQYLESIIRERAVQKKIAVSIPISPGLNGWPVSVGQLQIFQVLHPEPEIIQLLPSAQMSPGKSISFVMGLGCQAGNGTQCDLCGMRDRCQYQAEKNNGSF